MATAYDGIGMGQLGSESRFMKGDNPLSSALKGLKDFGIMYGMEKTGLFDYLNKAGQQKQAMLDKYPGLAPKTANPPAGAAVPSVANPAPVAPNSTGTVNTYPVNTTVFENTVPPIDQAPANQPIQTQPPNNGMSTEDAADHSMGIKGSFMNPDLFKPRDATQDQTALAMQTASPSVYPSPMNLPQYGQNSGGSGGLSSLFTLFA
jgi:hypothetical protein